jgi:hypothetical protein
VISSYQIDALPHAVEDLVVTQLLQLGFPSARRDWVGIATEQADELLHLARAQRLAFCARAEQHDRAVEGDTRRRHERRHARRVVRLCHADNVRREGVGFKPSACSRSQVARLEACSWIPFGGSRRSRSSRKQFVEIDLGGPIARLFRVKSPSLLAFADRKLEFSACLRLQCALIDRGGPNTTKTR